MWYFWIIPILISIAIMYNTLPPIKVVTPTKGCSSCAKTQE